MFDATSAHSQLQKALISPGDMPSWSGPCPHLATERTVLEPQSCSSKTERLLLSCMIKNPPKLLL